MKKELLALLKKEAFVRKKITLASGKTSDYYIDVRRVSLSARGVYLISQLVFEHIKDLGVHAFGGPTLGADPIVAGVCYLAGEQKLPLKGFLIRKTPKAHGQQQLLEGPTLSPGDRAVIVDDVATSGGSLVTALEVLRKENIEVVEAITVVDRQDGAKERLASMNCPLVSLFLKEDFLND